MTTTDQVFYNVPVLVEITRNRMCDLICSCIEGNSSWFLGVGEYKLPAGIKKSDFNEGEKLAFGDWTNLYSIMTHPNCKVGLVAEESVREDRDSFTVEVGPEELRRGLDLLSLSPKYKHHLTAFLEGNDDCDTADVFMQFVVYGEVVYC